MMRHSEFKTVVQLTPHGLSAAAGLVCHHGLSSNTQLTCTEQAKVHHRQG